MLYCYQVCRTLTKFSTDARTLSSAGSERLPYKQEVSGSIPLASTEKDTGPQRRPDVQVGCAGLPHPQEFMEQVRTLLVVDSDALFLERFRSSVEGSFNILSTQT